jgi:protein-tyrosine phosphatase
MTASTATSTPGPEMLRILVVCTANQCRSPMAEVLLRRALAGTPALVGSAGVSAADGVPATADAVAAMAERGLDLSAHRAARVRTEWTSAADLVLCMERAHVAAIVGRQPEVFPRTFTLPELARIVRERGGRHPDEPVPAWLARLHDGRRPADVLGGGRRLDVPDPVGRGRARYEETADQLDGLCRDVATALGGA